MLTRFDTNADAFAQSPSPRMLMGQVPTIGCVAGRQGDDYVLDATPALELYAAGIA